MTAYKQILALLISLGIQLVLLIAAAILDIILAALLIPFASRALMISCYGVAGVFSGVLCYGAVLDRAPVDQRMRFALYWLVGLSVECALLFLIAAPLSGQELKGPVRAFAVTEATTVIFLWKNKFFDGIGDA